MLATHPHGAPQPWVRHRWAVPFACTLALSIRPHQRPSPVTSHSLLSCLPPFLLHPPSPSRSLSRPTSFSTTRVLRSDTPTTQHLPLLLIACFTIPLTTFLPSLHPFLHHRSSPYTTPCLPRQTARAVVGLHPSNVHPNLLASSRFQLNDF